MYLVLLFSILLYQNAPSKFTNNYQSNLEQKAAIYSFHAFMLHLESKNYFVKTATLF